ncbi:hypothetical protein SAMN04488101_102597 [Pedobacter nyackensis]|uniref:Uncharacterized protein n=1 Tax=Pedobacter nyackensis TaxID=475255 RepID=A0A1W2BLN6_9SPHI|nr:hypothetical protein SAMN04488101_102597 [Pedobacter nyackensis]
MISTTLLAKYVISDQGPITRISWQNIFTLIKTYGAKKRS